MYSVSHSLFFNKNTDPASSGEPVDDYDDDYDADDVRENHEEDDAITKRSIPDDDDTGMDSLDRFEKEGTVEKSIRLIIFILIPVFFFHIFYVLKKISNNRLFTIRIPLGVKWSVLPNGHYTKQIDLCLFVPCFPAFFDLLISLGQQGLIILRLYNGPTFSKWP